MSIFFGGCVIGPVFETIGLVRRPLEIWMASYMYSRIAQIIIRDLNAKKGVEIVSPYETPKENRNEMFQGIRGAGTFSDHIIFRAEDMQRDAVDQMLGDAIDRMYTELSEEIIATIDNMYTELGEEIIATIGNGDLTDCKVADCKAYLQKKIYILTHVREAKDSDDFPIQEVIAALEKQDRFPPFLAKEDQNDYLLRYIDHDALKNSPWAKGNLETKRDGASDASEKVAMGDFGTIAHRSGNRALLLNDYLAVIYSDGDSMGTLNDVLAKTNRNAYNKLSEFIIARTEDNIEYVRKYGAMPIYFGGDDMFFIAPIIGNDPEPKDPEARDQKISVFDLVERLGERFDAAWKGFDALEKKEGFPNVQKDGKLIVPTLSFGIAISHYKYPFRHMRADCLNALFDVAKRQAWSGNRAKKAIAIELRKHSGQRSSLALCGYGDKNISAYSAVVKYIQSVIRNAKSRNADQSATQNAESRNGDSKAMLSRSMHWKVVEQYPLIEKMLELPDDERRVRLKAWFIANSSDSKDVDTVEFDLIIAAMCEVYDSLKDTYGAQDRIRNTIDGVFRLAEFMCTKTVNTGKKAGEAES